MFYDFVLWLLQIVDAILWQNVILEFVQTSSVGNVIFKLR